MYKQALCSALAAVSTVVLAVTPGWCEKADKLEWNRDLEKSLRQAKAENKLVLADVYTDWCGPCKQLEKTTFQDEKFVKFLKENFVLVKANAEDGGRGQQIADNNDVHMYPSGLVFNTNGKVVKTIIGYKDASSYEKELSKELKKARK